MENGLEYTAAMKTAKHPYSVPGKADNVEMMKAKKRLQALGLGVVKSAACNVKSTVAENLSAPTHYDENHSQNNERKSAHNTQHPIAPAHSNNTHNQHIPIADCGAADTLVRQSDACLLEDIATKMHPLLVSHPNG